MESWPVTVNQDVLRDDIEEAPQDSVHAFAAEVGPPIYHARTLTPGETVSFRQWFTPDEYSALKAWRLTNLRGGSLPFTRNNPFEAGTGTYVFYNGGLRLVGLDALQRQVELTLYRVA